MKTLTSRIKRRVLLLINNFKSDCAFSILYALLRVMDELCGRVHLNKLSNIAHEKKDKWICICRIYGIGNARTGAGTPGILPVTDKERQSI